MTTSEHARLDASGVLLRNSPPGVEWVEIDGEVVAWTAEDGALHRLDPIATLVFQLCDGDASLGQTVAELAEAFGRSPAAVEADVLVCAERLLAGGLVQLRS